MECLWDDVEKGRRRIWESCVLGIVFLVLGITLFLAEAGYEALRDRSATGRTRPYRISSGRRGGMRELTHVKGLR